MDEKITITAEFTKTDVAAALLCLGEELTPEVWEQVKAAPSKSTSRRLGTRLSVCRSSSA